jgi:hypothetical protein
MAVTFYSGGFAVADRDPTATDDFPSAGCLLGMLWINTTEDRVFRARTVEPDGEASWVRLLEAPDTVAEGDILYIDADGNVAALTAGDDGDVLTLASGLPSWAAPA